MVDLRFVVGVRVGWVAPCFRWLVRVVTRVGGFGFRRGSVSFIHRVCCLGGCQWSSSCWMCVGFSGFVLVLSLRLVVVLGLVFG